MAIVARVARLNLPLDGIVVIGSGVMDALGLRPSRDIDLVARPDVFAAVKQQPGWHARVRHDEEVLEKDDVEMWLSWDNGGTSNFQALYDGGLTIDGVRFANPRFVLNWKTKRSDSKNQADVTILREYLAHHE